MSTRAIASSPAVLVARHADPIAARAGAWTRRQVARALVARALDLAVIGLEHVPTDGPALLVARHHHHLFDATAILATVPREVHVVVALDWLGGGPALGLMRGLAGAARWPGVWRRGPGWRLNRHGYRLALTLLREGRLLLVFPEGYPTVDPAGSRKSGDFLPFDPGFLALAERAGPEVPIVPVGVWYAPRPRGGWTVCLRFGQPLVLGRGPAVDRRAALAAVEAAVRRLSAPPPI